MLKQFILILIGAISLTGKTHGQTFAELTSRIFYDADLKRKDSTLISYFNSRPELRFEEQTGWTVYPPADAQNNPLPFHIFTFSKHPYFSSALKKGRLMVVTNKNLDSIVGLTIALLFNSKTEFDSTYKKIRELYDKKSSKTIKRPNMAPPFEVTKYLSNDGKYIIVTTGENDSGSYMHIAFNFQDYVW